MRRIHSHLARGPLLATSALVLAAMLLAGLLAGCTRDAAASFDPSGPCTADGKRAGAYPDLEALIPRDYGGAPPKRLDSGRNCSDASLGTLAEHGIADLQFAGGLWGTGARSGVTIAVFRADGLTTARVAELYETGARSARKTENVTTSAFSVGSVEGRRLDTLNDESFQTILVLDGPSPGLVRAVLVASDVREVGTMAAHEAIVERAAETAVGR